MEVKELVCLRKMLNTLRFCLCNVSRSSFVNYSVYREARILQKFIDRGLKKKKDWGKSTGKLSEELIPLNESGICSRRVAMLNKAYVQALMSIMSTGKNSNDLHKLGIHITKVKLSNNLKILNIYWTSPNSTGLPDEDLKNILDQTASELQYHIISYRVTGKTPTVRFVKDLASQSYSQVLNLLLTLKEEEEEDVEVAKPSTDSLADEEEDTSESLVEYTHDVLGLDHAKIMGRIQAAKSKSKTFDLTPSQSDKGRVEKLIPFDKKTFEKFYFQKYRLAKKMNKFESRPNQGSAFDECYEIDDDLIEKYCNRFEEDWSVWDEDISINEDGKNS